MQGVFKNILLDKMAEKMRFNTRHIPELSQKVLLGPHKWLVVCKEFGVSATPAQNLEVRIANSCSVRKPHTGKFFLEVTEFL